MQESTRTTAGVIYPGSRLERVNMQESTQTSLILSNAARLILLRISIINPNISRIVFFFGFARCVSGCFIFTL